MILTGRQILQARDEGRIRIDPWRDAQLNPNSYNLRLWDELAVYTPEVLDMAKPNAIATLKIPAEGLVLQPGRLYLGRTLEYTETEGMVPMLEGRSSVGRLGLFVHVTAGFGDIGFRGYWTLEISCIQPVRIYAGVEICQIFYHTVSGAYDSYGAGKYQANTGIQASMLWKDFPQG
ncbi:MAG TPA: dCTP deaminase [Holophagaceae bacterium]|nr:dCTP deaminase [Holophagaceae bacterium]